MNRTRPLARIFSSPLKPSHTTTPPRLVRHIIIPPTCSTFPTTTTFNNSNNNHNHDHSHNTPRPFSTTTNKMAPSAQELIELAKARRSYYPLSKDLSITPARVQEIVKDLLDHVPSSFNSQSNRVVVLFGADHEKLWDITAEILKPMVTPEQWESTAGKMAMFKGAAGTVRILFFYFQLSLFFLLSVALRLSDSLSASIFFYKGLTPLSPCVPDPPHPSS